MILAKCFDNRWIRYTLVAYGWIIIIVTSCNGYAQSLDDKLLRAVEDGNPQRVQTLLDKGANPNVKNVSGESALVIASAKGLSDIVAVLLVRGVDFNAKDKKGLTPLMLASSQCNAKIVMLLWNAGAEAFQQDILGNNAQTYAENGKCPDIVRAAAADRCKDLSHMYKLEELEKRQGLYADKLATAKYLIEAELEREDKNIEMLRATKVPSLLFQDECKQPFYAATTHTPNVIHIPLFTIKMLQDLIAADVWFSKHGFESHSYLYIESIKYKRAVDFPGNKYPRPLDALAVPQNMEGEIKFDDPQMAAQAEKLFSDALLFIVAHECGHIFLNHSGSTSGNEMAADLWALDRIGMAGKSIAGAVPVLAFLGYWAPNRADFESEFDYQTWIATQSGYPSTVARLIMVASAVSESPWKFASADADHSGTTIEEIKKTAASMRSLAKMIEKNTSDPKLFWDVLRTQLSAIGRKEVETQN